MDYLQFKTHKGTAPCTGRWGGLAGCAGKAGVRVGTSLSPGVHKGCAAPAPPRCSGLVTGQIGYIRRRRVRAGDHGSMDAKLMSLNEKWSQRPQRGVEIQQPWPGEETDAAAQSRLREAQITHTRTPARCLISRGACAPPPVPGGRPCSLRRMVYCVAKCQAVSESRKAAGRAPEGTLGGVLAGDGMADLCRRAVAIIVSLRGAGRDLPGVLCRGGARWWRWSPSGSV